MPDGVARDDIAAAATSAAVAQVPSRLRSRAPALRHSAQTATSIPAPNEARYAGSAFSATPSHPCAATRTFQAGDTAMSATTSATCAPTRRGPSRSAAQPTSGKNA